MNTLGVLVFALVLVGIVLYWSSHFGGRGVKGVSLKRSANAHTTARGTPKRGFETRTAAEAEAQKLAQRNGVPMNVYQCSTCSKWHLGHSK